MAAPDAPSAGAFRAWLDASGFSVDVVAKRDHEQWYAVLPQFDLAGQGESAQDAARDAIGLLIAYLRVYYEDGAAFEDALRPMPRADRLRLRAEACFIVPLKGHPEPEAAA